MFAIVHFKNIQIKFKKQDKLDLRKSFVCMRASNVGQMVVYNTNTDIFPHNFKKINRFI